MDEQTTAEELARLTLGEDCDPEVFDDFITAQMMMIKSLGAQRP